MKPGLLARSHPLADPSRQRLILRPGGDVPSFESALEKVGLAPLRARGVATLQINLGRMCNQTCEHCHVDAGPDRREIMPRPVLESCLRVLRTAAIPTVDLTGGAPELHPDFEWFVREARADSPDRRIIDRCNLTILMVPRFRELAGFLAGHRVEIVASLPCYLESNTDQQRGGGVHRDSIAALKRLNALGYGEPGSGLVLNLVHNPVGPSLPPPQPKLEADYRRELEQRHGVRFNNLLTIANMPINRMLEKLLADGSYESYMRLLVEAFNPEAAARVMCRDLISVGWDGRLHDCDFNQMLDIPLLPPAPRTIDDFDPEALAAREIATGLHCHGCAAGAGSGCGGALIAEPIPAPVPTGGGGGTGGGTGIDAP